MGGLNSGITKGTNSVFIESAHFNKLYVRKTAKYHCISNQSSFRFERGVDPNDTIFILDRTANLIKDITNCAVSSFIDNYPNQSKSTIINISYSYINKIIGKNISKKKINSILESLHIRIKNENTKSIELEIPSYRLDIQSKIDIVEEIIRIYGYNKIQNKEYKYFTINNSSKVSKTNRLESIRSELSKILYSRGYQEIITSPLISKDYIRFLQKNEKDKVIQILNSISPDKNFLRWTMLLSGLEIISYNLNRKNFNLKFFESGRIYLRDEGVFNEKNILSIFITGKKNTPSWQVEDKDTDFYQLKNEIDDILISLELEKSLTKVNEPDNYSNYGLKYQLNGKTIAYLGSLSKNIMKYFSISQNIFYAYIEYRYLNKLRISPSYKETPKFPIIERDLSLILDNDILFKDIESISYEIAKPLIKKIHLINIYKDKHSINKKTYSLRFFFQPEKDRLSKDTINNLMRNLIVIFEDKLKAIIKNYH